MQEKAFGGGVDPLGYQKHVMDVELTAYYIESQGLGESTWLENAFQGAPRVFSDEDPHHKKQAKVLQMQGLYPDQKAGESRKSCQH
jgi:hypothetical protein